MNSENLIITKHCIIKQNQIIIDGKEDFSMNSNENFPDFIRAVYRNYKISYQKFFKMDNLSKLGFITAELLLQNNDFLDTYKNEEIGIIISNSGSSIDTDIKFNNTIKDKENYFPSPKVFVYTLPNIVIGEICIRNKIQGESTFLISEKFNPDFSYNYIKDLFDKSKIESCICGWVDFENDKYQSLLFLVEKNNNKNNKNINFEPKNVRELFE